MENTEKREVSVTMKVYGYKKSMKRIRKMRKELKKILNLAEEIQDLKQKSIF